jgi:hypothetical protein
VATDRNDQAQDDDGEPAEDECRAPRRIGEQSDRGNSEKESSGHNQQSGVLHLRILYLKSGSLVEANGLRRRSKNSKNRDPKSGKPKIWGPKSRDPKNWEPEELQVRRTAGPRNCV